MTYELLRSQDLLVPVDEWEVIATAAATDDTLRLSDSNPPAEQAFYTVRVRRGGGL